MNTPQTKDEEILLIQKTINRLPESYLRSILISEHDAIEKAIRDDFGFIDLAGTMARVCHLREEATRLERFAQEQEKRAAKAQEKAQSALERLAELRNIARNAQDRAFSLQQYTDTYLEAL